jgi:hypothetical protein
MDAQIAAALLALGLTVIGALGTLVTLLVERVKRDLATNTQITTEARDAADGRLSDTLSHLAAERNRSLALREIVRERDDRLAYLAARLPDATSVLRGYEERRQARATSAEEAAALRRILDDNIDDPTGTDAGAHQGPGDYRGPAS